MKLGLYSMNFGTCADPDVAVSIAQHAEAAGLESVWIGEHVVLPRHPPEWFTMPHTLPFLDSIVALTLLGAHTSTLRIGSGILELPLHNPIRLAKQLASVDRITHGRLLVGLGAGYLAPEFMAMGADLADRAECMDEFIGAMRALWSMAEPEYRGRHVDFADVDAYPRPVQVNGPPIIIGGLSGSARRRAIRSANGWFVYNTTIESMQEILDAIARDMKEIERPRRSVPSDSPPSRPGRSIAM